MLDANDWETFWRWERFRRACDPVDFRRWKRDSAQALRGLYADRPDALLLDATAGLGDHTVNLAEEGFRVEACDVSPLARESTRESLRDAGLDVLVHDVAWEALGDRFPGRYDVIFHDALHWIYEPDALDAALRGLYRALRPGGELVFFYADARDPAPDAGARVLAWDWSHMERAELGWDLQRGETSVTLTRVNERGHDYIDQHHLFVIREGGRARLESLTMRRVYRWDWHGITPRLAAAGFVDARSEHFRNVKGHTFSMNLCRRPA